MRLFFPFCRKCIKEKLAIDAYKVKNGHSLFMVIFVLLVFYIAYMIP